MAELVLGEENEYVGQVGQERAGQGHGKRVLDKQAGGHRPGPSGRT